MRRTYTEGFKEQAVQKSLTRGNKSLRVQAKELNISVSTLDRWRQDYTKMNEKHDKSQRPQDWSREKQLQAILDTAGMDAEHSSQYCREKGLFPHHLKEWRLNFIQPSKAVEKNHQTDVKALRQENAQLQKELRRKDKALAETAALLVLQKKFQALLEDEEK